MRTVRICWLGVFWTGCLVAAVGAERRPNIVLVMSDDQGFGDFGCHGNPVLETPHLDRLAAACPKVHRFYVSPVCSPTRASLLTGRYNYRTRVVDTWVGRSMMEPAEVTLAEILREAGYRTGIFGKWHLGDCYPLRPQDQGFDEVLVHRGGGLAQPSEPPENERRYTDPWLLHNGELGQVEGYCTDVFFRSALQFISDSVAQQQPFFAYIAPNAPHGPFHDVPEQLLEKYRGLDLSTVQYGDGKNADRVARIYAMIENIDHNLGRLMDHLQEIGQAEDTLLVFLNDNGPVAGRYAAGLRGGKGGVYEGGIRSPLFVRWPGRLSPQTQVHPIAAHIDVVPTLLDAVGLPPPPAVKLDGRSLYPMLLGREDPATTERHLIVQSHRGDAPVPFHHFAIVGQHYKLLRPSGFGNERPQEDCAFELYDLQDDPGETTNLAPLQSERVASFCKIYEAWFRDVSSTRPENYAPPRIVVGTAAEPVTVLTHQDWRAEKGWGRNGTWLLNLLQPTTFEVHGCFLDVQQFDRVRVHVGEEVLERNAVVNGKSFSLGLLDLPAGDVDLWLECLTAPEPRGPYQLTLQTKQG